MDLQALNDLKANIKGAVAVAGDDVYDTARTMFEYQANPSVVVRPESHEDIANTLYFAKKHAVPFIIRSGGHGNLKNFADDGMIIIDMSYFKAIEILSENDGLVRVGAGALWHEVATELSTYKLGLSSGDTRTVGVGGLATGGGIGWMIRKHGPLVDNITAVEMILADGSVMTASQHENADLFWAVRGGGSNFGIVTHFTFKARPVHHVFRGNIKYPLKDVKQVLQGWRNAMRSAPLELSTILMIMPGFGGNDPSIMIQGCFVGEDEDAANKAYAPFLTLGNVTHSAIEKMPYMNILEDAKRPPNIEAVVQNAFIKEFSDDVIDAIAGLTSTDRLPMLQISHVAGAMNQLPASATAFSHRDSEVLIVNPSVIHPPHTEKEVEAAKAPWKAIEPFGQGVYLNLLNENTEKELTKAFPPAALERLREIKSVYDPENIFRTNHNVTPLR